MHGRTADAFAMLEHQLAEERVGALGRIGGRLDTLLRLLADLTARFGDLAGHERVEALVQYQSLHAEARRYRWYLEVQRDAVGIRGHDVVDRMYPLPPRNPVAASGVQPRTARLLTADWGRRDRHAARSGH